jgi:hypothetical protein
VLTAIEEFGVTDAPLFETLSRHLSQRFGLQIQIAESDATRSQAMEVASLRDGKIQLSPARSPEQQAFILAHVFGHLVQNLSRSAHIALLEKIEAPPPIFMSTSLKFEYLRYEMDAYAWGDLLIRQCVLPTKNMLHRYTTYAVVDFATFAHYLETGRRVDNNKFQAIYQNSLRAKKKPLWNITGKRMPDELIVDNLELKVV